MIEAGGIAGNSSSFRATILTEILGDPNAVLQSSPTKHLPEKLRDHDLSGLVDGLVVSDTIPRRSHCQIGNQNRTVACGLVASTMIP